MKKYRALSAALAGIFIYVLVSVFGGRDGVFAYKQQLEQKRILSTRLETIQKINDSLQLECTALENDHDVIEGLAKKLGYVSAGDKIVIITNFNNAEETVYEAGIPVKAEEPEFISEKVGKILGLVVFFIVYLYLLYTDFRSGAFRKHKDDVFVEGVPVYDLPQV